MLHGVLIMYSLFLSTGIGFYTAQELARQGAKVYLGARDEGKGKAAVAKILAELGNSGGPYSAYPVLELIA